MKHARRAVSVLALISALSLAGCAENYSGRSYGWYDTRQPMTIHRGVVESVRHVQIQGTQTGVGAMSGATVGAIAGSTVGEGSGSALASVAGAILGGLAGNAIEKDATQRNGLEIDVRLDNGRLLAIVQQADEAFYPGDQVEVLTAPDGSVRVRHLRR